MKRTIDEWDKRIEDIIVDSTRNGMEWAILRMLAQIAYILLDMRDAQQTQITSTVQSGQRVKR